MYHKILNMTLSPREDHLLFVTDSNQLIKVSLNLERPGEDSKYEYLVSSFHSNTIFGLDLCVKKQIIATCSSDRTVRIWSYTNLNQYQLEICQVYTDEAYSVALHPSGFHLVAGFNEQIRLMNILDKSLEVYKTLPVKQCRELKFSNGGHLFAC